MCLCLPHVPHHNTIVVENEEQLQPFRPVTVSFKRRAAVIAPYVPHHNTVIVSSKNNTEPPSAKYMDEKQHFILQLESGSFKEATKQKEQLEAFQDDIVKPTKSNLVMKAE